MASLDLQELKKAAVFGDVEFLKKCVESKQPVEYYTTFYRWDDDRYHHGNILHIAARENSEEFIRQVIGILPIENTQQLLLQQTDNALNPTCNPLHVAGRVGNVEIVKMFLSVFESTNLPAQHSKRPWLQRNGIGHLPCHIVFFSGHEECALEIFKMDTEVQANMTTRRDISLLYEALLKKFVKLALEIVRSPHSISCAGLAGATPLHALRFINYSEEAEEIFRQLVQREQKQIKQVTNKGYSIFHSWSRYGKLWPFKCFLKSNDIILDVKMVFMELTMQTKSDGDNPLHVLVEPITAPSEDSALEIAQFLIETFNKEFSSTQELSISEDQLPWLVENNNGDTPLSLAIDRQFEKLAMYILSVDENAVIKCQKNVMFLAIEKRCNEVTQMILEIVNKHGWTQVLINDQQNVLHLAPFCTRDFCEQLIEGHPELFNRVDGRGILHSWIRNGEVWPFEYFFTSKWRSYFSKLIGATDYKDRNTPFHVAATTTHETMEQVLELLVDAYKEEMPNWNVSCVSVTPWFKKNKKHQGPLHLAILNQREKLALYILSLYEGDLISELLDYYDPENSTLFLAIQHDCSQVSKAILARLDKGSWSKYVKDAYNGRNILHLAPSLTDIELGTWLVNEASEFITEQDNNGQSPWDKAYEVGLAWFIKAVLKKDPSMFSRAPLVWIKACENGHVSALRTFIEHNPGAFRDLCIEHKDSPLHHIRLQNVTEYEQFLKIPRMKDLLNVQDSQAQTPLHKAIRREDLYLTETLLNMDKIIYDISDNQNVTAMDLLAYICKEREAWRQMCKRNGLDPNLKTTYFKHKTNLLDVRTSLFVVAALLATITFTAGFTLPGGFNQDTGEALLAKNSYFLVFLVSDTLALFFSMLVLICLTWSMVFETSKSLILIDRSMVLLRVALNCTLLTFLTGVYTVIAPKSLWVAILIIAIISSLILISINKRFLYEVMDKLLPASNKECRDPMRLLELGYNSREEHDSLLISHDDGLNSSG